jgi:DNA-binding NarL/FixJ family response regulator
MGVKTYLVEDHEDMRFLLKQMLKRKSPTMVILGESETAETALVEIPRFYPDLALIDISLPGMDGIELVRRLREILRALCILVITGHEVDLYRDQALAAGADGIASKADTNGILTNIERILSTNA